MSIYIACNRYSIWVHLGTPKMILSQLNPHYRDKYITFSNPSHTYSVRGYKSKYSVTAFVSLFFDKFIAKDVSTKLASNANPGSEYYGLSPEEISAKWEQERDMGTSLHEAIETYLNNPSSPVPDRFDVVVDLLKSWELVPYRTEWRVYDDKYNIAGTVDFVARNKNTGMYYLFDWKRSKNITWTRFDGKKAMTVCNDMHDCNGSTYALQLNTYKYILETNYDIKISGMYLVNLHPSLKHVDVMPIEDMGCKVVDMMATIK